MQPSIGSDPEPLRQQRREAVCIISHLGYATNSHLNRQPYAWVAIFLCEMKGGKATPVVLRKTNPVMRQDCEREGEMFKRKKAKINGKTVFVLDVTKAAYTQFGVGVKKGNPTKCLYCGKPIHKDDTWVKDTSAPDPKYGAYSVIVHSRCISTNSQTSRGSHHDGCGGRNTCPHKENQHMQEPVQPTKKKPQSEKSLRLRCKTYDALSSTIGGKHRER